MLKFFNESGSQWRVLANIWMALAMLVFAASLFFQQFSPLTGAVSIIYVAILSIYAGTKECNRWSHYHRSRHLGELTIIIWTAFLITLIIGNLTLYAQFTIPQELIAVYTGVLAIFAVTQRSKNLFEKRGLKLKSACPAIARSDFAGACPAIASGNFAGACPAIASGNFAGVCPVCGHNAGEKNP